MSVDIVVVTIQLHLQGAVGVLLRVLGDKWNLSGSSSKIQCTRSLLSVRMDPRPPKVSLHVKLKTRQIRNIICLFSPQAFLLFNSWDFPPFFVLHFFQKKVAMRKTCRCFYIRGMYFQRVKWSWKMGKRMQHNVQLNRIAQRSKHRTSQISVYPRMKGIEVQIPMRTWTNLDGSGIKICLFQGKKKY